jgi:hypothetical protein
MLRRPVLTAIIALVFACSPSAQGDSWFRADPVTVAHYSKELGDRARPTTERLEALHALRILFTVYGAYNFQPALPILKAVRREAGQVGAPAGVLFDDLQTALKRPDKRLPQ